MAAVPLILTGRLSALALTFLELKLEMRMKKIIYLLLMFACLNSYGVGRLQNEDFKSLSDLTSAVLSTTGNLTSGSPCISSPGSVAKLGVGQFVYDVTNPLFIPSGTTIIGLPGSCSVGQIKLSANAISNATGDNITFGGVVSSLLNDSKIYVTANNINDQLSNAISNGRIGGAGGAGGINTLATLNWDFEAGSGNWTASGGTFSVITVNPLFAQKSGSWTPTAAGQNFDSALVNTPIGLQGTNSCSASIWTKWNGTSGNIVFEVVDGSNNLIASTNLPSIGQATKTQLFFACPATMRTRLTSLAAESAVIMDNTILGQDSLVALGDTNPICTIIASTLTADFGDYKVADGRAISRGDFSDYMSNCGTTFGSGNGSTTVNLPDMRGRFLRGADINTNVAASGRDPDGASRTAMNSGGNTSVLLPGSIQGSQFTSHNHTIWGNNAGNVSAGNRFIMIASLADPIGTDGIANAGDAMRDIGNVQNAGGSETRPINANVSYFIKVRGGTTQTAMNITTVGWHVDATITGPNPVSSGGNVPTLTVWPGIAGMVLANSLGNNVIPSMIACSGSFPPTGTTCTSGTPQPGISFIAPVAGDVRICAQFGTELNETATGRLFGSFTLAETPANSDSTIIQTGNAITAWEYPSGFNGITNIHSNLCGTFHFTFAGQHTIRLFYAQNASGTLTSNPIILADGSIGGRNIHYTVIPINQNVPAPVFADITTFKNNLLAVGRNFIDGFQTSASGSFMTIGAGAANDSTNTVTISSPTSFTKNLAAGWSAGSGNGGLDTGSATANSTYNVFVIENPISGAVDILFSLSPTSPTMPTGYTLKRRVFTMYAGASAGQWFGYRQFGERVYVNSPQVGSSSLSIAPGVYTTNLSFVPTGIQVEADFNFGCGGVNNQVTGFGWIAPTTITAPGSQTLTYGGNVENVNLMCSGGHTAGEATLLYHQNKVTTSVWTNTSAQVNLTFSSDNSTNIAYILYVVGWTDHRGKDGI